MIGPRKEYFNRKRAAFVATWTTDANGIVHIPLKNGFEATISESKKEIASDFTWRLKKHSKKSATGPDKYYAEASVPEEYRGRFKHRHESLHRVVSGVPDGVQVDHKNGNGLDCTDGNIRWATTSQNTSNRHYKNSTGYRGVFKIWKSGNFGAQIDYQGKNHYLGSFPTAQQAARRYNAEAIEIFGDFAILNKFADDYDGDLVDLMCCETLDFIETMVA